MAQRREAAQLLVVGTYRPVEATVRTPQVHAVTQELRRHGQCTELVPRHLPTAAVVTYLARRFEGQALPLELAEVLHQRTDGNPLGRPGWLGAAATFLGKSVYNRAPSV